jgi:hypothetical protein
VERTDVTRAHKRDVVNTVQYLCRQISDDGGKETLLGCSVGDADYREK